MNGENWGIKLVSQFYYFHYLFMLSGAERAMLLLRGSQKSMGELLQSVQSLPINTIFLNTWILDEA